MGLSRKFAIVAVVLSLGVAGLAQAPPKTPKKQAPRKAAKARKPSAAVAAPVAAPVQTPRVPPAPLRPEQMPAVPPDVTYQNGELSIVAQNSTLSSILSAVKARTGAQVEMPADTVNERVVVKLGPGNPRDVLGALLEGSRFDYIVLGSADDPNALSQVILTPHQGGAGLVPAAAAASAQRANQPAAAFAQPPAAPMRGGVTRPEMPPEEVEEPSAEAPPQPGPPAPAMPATPGMAPPQGPGNEPNAAQPPQPGVPKTPEQLLQELQRMQQQQQQQQQQGPAGRRQPPQS